jgi:hypothetical protein
MSAGLRMSKVASLRGVASFVLPKTLPFAIKDLAAIGATLKECGANVIESLQITSEGEEVRFLLQIFASECFAYMILDIRRAKKRS